jgi:ribosomal protein L7Ae-like RNA K-turn-binding protein
VWVLFLAYGACFGIEITFDNVAALYFVDHFQLGLKEAGILAGIFGLMNLFARAFKAQVVVPPDLGGMVDGLLARSALGMLGLARKAGAISLGATKVESAVRSGLALFVLHATEASDDGVRKISQARRATVHLGGPSVLAYKLFSEAELSLALGGTNVIHAAVLAGDAGKAVEKRMVALDRYRGGTPDDLAMLAAVADEDDAAEDME